MASRCIRADTGLEQKIPLGALVLGFGRCTAPLPRRFLRAGEAQEESANKDTVVTQSQGVNPVSLVLWNRPMAQTN